MNEKVSVPSPVLSGLVGRCPRCGKGALFTSLLNLRPNCESCGLDYAFIDTGDGPAVFAIFILEFYVKSFGKILSQEVRGAGLQGLRWACYGCLKAC